MAISSTISRFMYEAFRNKRDENKNKITTYPVIYYDMIHQLTRELASDKSKKFKFLEVRTVGGIWLLGEFSENKISEETYRCLWNNLLVAIEYNRDDMILSFWKTTHQYITYNLSHISPEYSNETNSISNQKDIDEREKERMKFLEFHYALGGLLLYKERYDCIKRIWDYTTSTPPKYELLPSSMDEIFKMFFHFEDPYSRSILFISHSYPFPEMEGLGSDGLIKKWILKYICFLFLRQYTITPYLSYMKPLYPTTSPLTLRDKRLWMDNLNWFEELFSTIYTDHLTKEQLKLDFINDEWCEAKGKPTPTQILNQTINNVKVSYENSKMNLVLSDSKIEKFNKNLIRSLNSTFNSFLGIHNNNLVTHKDNSYKLFGDKQIFEKTAFSDEQDIAHLNADSILAEKAKYKIENWVSDAFLMLKSKSYLVYPNDIFKAIDKLKLNKNKHVLVSFGIKPENLEKKSNQIYNYNEIDFVYIKSFNYRDMGESVFALKKTDLPSILNFSPSENEINKYNLNELYPGSALYSSVIDLNLNEEARNEIALIPSLSGDPRKYVLAVIFMNIEMRWNEKVRLIQIKSYSKYRDREIPITVNNVNEFN